MLSLGAGGEENDRRDGLSSRRMATPLGSVLERDEPSHGPRGRLTVAVPEAWLEPGSVLEVVVPARLACARCEGGGCDACGRSGAIRLPGDEKDRALRITLSESARGVRLTRPFGADAGLDQLVIELRPAPVASELCRRVARPAQRPSLIALLVTIALVSALLAALVLRR